jgi:excisionase family DNA binding protein
MGVAACERANRYGAVMTTESNHEPDRLAYTIEQFSRSMGIGRTSTYELINEGKLHAIKVAGRTLIPRESALKLLAEADRVKS